MGLVKRMRKLSRRAGRRALRFGGKTRFEFACAEVGQCVAPGPVGIIGGVVAGHVIKKAVRGLKKRRRKKG